jgi:hypothetical protein
LLPSTASRSRLLWLGQHDCLAFLTNRLLLTAGRGLFGLAPGCGLSDFGEECGDFFEELLDVDSCFSADFLEEDVIAFGEFLALCVGDVPVLEVDFVGEEGDDDALAALVLDVVDPLLNALEGVAIGDVVDYDCDGGVADVVGDEGLKAFLPGGVPELEADGLVLEEDVLRDEVDPDGRPLSGTAGTCSLPSKMS